MSAREMLAALRSAGQAVRPPSAEPPLELLLRLCRAALYRTGPAPNLPRLQLQIDAGLIRSLERINLGNWREVPVPERQIITTLVFYQILLKITLNEKLDNDALSKELFKIIDQGLLFGAPLPLPHADLLHKCASIIESNMKNQNPIDEKVKFNQTIVTEDVYTVSIQNSTNIKVEVCPSIQLFHESYMKPKLPLILQKCITHWPAIDRWTSPEYLIKKIGHRIVPVELGSKYTDSEWTQKLMSASDFINDYIINQNTTTGYLAQHQLFNQIPELFDDFTVPDYCELHESDTFDSNPDINAWFGPSGTISPLHNDPKHNLLTQIFGEKLVILYSPEDGSNLYCHSENLLDNTAQVDPLNPDFEKFPDFLNAKPIHHILKAGEILYIPPKWWHYVMSLSVSFSISFWWN